MTSPIPRAVKDACRAALPSLLAAHGLGAGAPIVQDEEGWVNPCYFVGDELVARFNSRDPELPKFARETVAFGLLRPLGIPVPEIVLHDRSCRHAPYEVLLARRLPGTTIERSWPSLDSALRTTLAQRVGELMAALHDVDPGGFGELAAPAAVRTSSLVDVVRALLRTRLDAARREGVLDEEDAARARRVVARREDALRAVTRPSLVHGDLHFGNVLHVGDAISGVLDFEWSRSGDAVDELASSHCIGELWPDAIDDLMSAYRARRPLETGHRARLEVHCVVHNIHMCLVSRHHFPDEADETLAAARAHLIRLDAQ